LELSKQILKNKAKSSEIALITIGRNAGENADRNVENDFNLAIDEINLIDNVARPFMLKAKGSSCCFKHRWCYRNGKLEK
jgi:beta-glucosidase